MKLKVCAGRFSCSVRLPLAILNGLHIKCGTSKLVLEVPRKVLRGSCPAPGRGPGPDQREKKNPHKTRTQRRGQKGLQRERTGLKRCEGQPSITCKKEHKQQEHGAQTRQTQTHTQKKDKRARATSESKSPTKHEGNLLSSQSPDRAHTVVVVCSASDKPPAYGDYKHPAADVC